MNAVDEWLKHNEPTREVTSYWRPTTSERVAQEKGLTLHPCDSDGRPRCKCGRVALRQGNLGPVRALKRRPPQRCEMTGLFLHGGIHDGETE